MPWIALIEAAFVSYLCGSFPSGFVAGKVRGVDLRREGSGNVGATNALRVLGKGWGYAVFLADAVKGVLAVRGAIWLATVQAPGWEIPFGVIGALGAVIGHNFPIWLGFHGGKGISTSAGVIAALFPPAVFISGLLAWIIVFYGTRYVSLASLAAAAALPASSITLALLGRCDWILAGVALVLCLLATWRHRPNIVRLMQGTEKRFARRKETFEN